MTTTPLFRRLLVLAVLGLTTVPGVASADIERRLERTFRVSADSVVTVDISGGSITTRTGPRGTVELTLTQIMDVDSEREADELLSLYTIAATQQSGDVRLEARRKQGTWDNDSRRGRRGVRMVATLTIPADVRVDLNTSGGSITVRGDRTAPTDADTSGGSITVEGGRGTMALDTSGGSISVGRVLSSLRADTSGGAITVDYVGPTAKNVSVDTSGGSITVGVDPDAKLDFVASTSGGSVSVEGLGYEVPANSGSRSRSRSRASGSINGGGGSLRASTSGGNIRIKGSRF